MVLCAALVAAPAFGSPFTESLKKGTPEIKSISTLAFGPEGLLFIGDTTAAAVVAIDTGDSKQGGAATVDVEKIDEKIGAMLGTTSKDVRINDVKVNPASGNVYIAVARGTGNSAAPVLVKLDRAGKLSEVSLKDIPFASVSIANVNDKRRGESITGLAFVDGKLIVAGLSNEEFASKLRVFAFPFREADKGVSVEIYHGAHGKFETASPVRTFTTYKIAGESHILAAYTCTPLVKFPVEKLKTGEKVQGTTIAELGNQNQPLDMVIYTKGGKDFILIANSKRGVMKVNTDEIQTVEPIVKKTGVAGLKYETVADLKGVMQLDKLDNERALILVRKDDGQQNLQTIQLP